MQVPRLHLPPSAVTVLRPLPWREPHHAGCPCSCPSRALSARRPGCPPLQACPHGNLLSCTARISAVATPSPVGAAGWGEGHAAFSPCFSDSWGGRAALRPLADRLAGLAPLLVVGLPLALLVGSCVATSPGARGEARRGPRQEAGWGALWESALVSAAHGRRRRWGWGSTGVRAPLPSSAGAAQLPRGTVPQGPGTCGSRQGHLTAPRGLWERPLSH